MSRSHGTGYPIFFECSIARQFYSRDPSEQRRYREQHKVTLTGRKRKAPGHGKGHPRKSFESREYKCSCGHIGWSCHKDLERMEEHMNAKPFPEMTGEVKLRLDPHQVSAGLLDIITTHGGVPTEFDIHQAMYIANLPLDVLGESAMYVYAALTAYELKAFVPLRNWRAVMEDEDLSDDG